MQGNIDVGCFPRALSLYVFGTEELYIHVRMFIIASVFVSREAYFKGLYVYM